MGQGKGKQGASFDAAGIAIDKIARLAADMWADLPFDRDALAALKRDGLVVDGLKLGGPCPYRFRDVDGGQMLITASGERADMLLDLWRVHFQRRLKPHNLAA
jgi:hypothetical protein